MSFTIQQQEINALFTQQEIARQSGNYNSVREYRDRIVSLFESIDFNQCSDDPSCEWYARVKHWVDVARDRRDCWICKDFWVRLVEGQEL